MERDKTMKEIGMLFSGPMSSKPPMDLCSGLPATRNGFLLPPRCTVVEMT